MTKLGVRPVANGLRTDNPIPGLPFVDDRHLPMEEAGAIEAVGRNKGEGMWGREDSCSIYGGDGWAAFTTEPSRHELGWAVRWHPEHGHSVVLYRDDDTPAVHQAWQGPAILFRAGGYWLDGSGTWYRPSRVWDAPNEDYYRRPVPAAITVTAADLLDGTGDPGRVRVQEVTEVDLEEAVSGRWIDHLALWAASRPDGAVALDRCVVDLAAPELTGDQLVGVAELAAIGGIAASTLRAYIARGMSEVPLPQATVGGRNVWSRPVADDWAEQRRRSPEGVSRTISGGRDEDELPGFTAIRNQLSRVFMVSLWDAPDGRRRWALRWRNQALVRDVADELSLRAAEHLEYGGFINMKDLGATIRHALLDELAYSKSLQPAGPKSAPFYSITDQPARMLDWLIAHDPDGAGAMIGLCIGEAERRLGIPRDMTERSLRRALLPSKALDNAKMRSYLDLVMTPKGN